jgi:hypothetical protein
MRSIIQEDKMSRLTAITLLCVVFSIPAFASDEEVAPAVQEAIEGVAVEGLVDLPHEVLKELAPETVAAILEATTASQALEYALEKDQDHYDLEGIIVPTALCLTILLGLVSSQMLRSRKQAQLHQTLRLMIEKGRDIPSELFAPPSSAHSDLRRGLILVGIGLSLLILIGLVEGFADGSWAVGLIPAFIGIAYLIVWKFSQRAENP